MSSKPYYTRIALVGVAMYLFAAALVLVATLIFEPSSAPFPIVVGAISLIIGAIIYRFQPWGLIAAVLGGLFGLLFSMDDLVLDLSSPTSFFDFAFKLLTFIGAILILASGIAGLVQHFQHKTATDGPSLQTTAVKGILGVVAVLSIISAIATIAGNGSVSAADKQGAQTITAHKTKYDTDKLTATASGTTKIVFKNKDPYVHTFSIDDLGIDVKGGPGSENLIELSGVKPGIYEFYCKVSGHKEDMHGTITVQ